MHPNAAYTKKNNIIKGSLTRFTTYERIIVSIPKNYLQKPKKRYSKNIFFQYGNACDAIAAFFVPTDILLWFPIRTSFIQEENENMKEIFQEYGGILITVVAILAVILVITAVVGTDTSGPIGSAFQTLVKNFIDQANKNTGLPTP